MAALRNSRTAIGKLRELTKNAGKDLLTSLGPQAEGGQRVPIGDLAPALRNKVHDLLGLGVLRALLGPLGDSVLYGGLAAYEQSPEAATITLYHGNGLMTASTTMIGRYRAYSGFGLAIPGLPATEEPPVPPSRTPEAIGSPR